MPADGAGVDWPLVAFMSSVSLGDPDGSGATDRTSPARGLGTVYFPGGPPPGPIARRFAARTLTLLATFQNVDGSWNANTVQTALILPALRAAGLAASHPIVVSTVAWLEAQQVRDGDGLHFEAFGSPVWRTAANVRGLIAAGESPADPRMMRALEWLIEAQSRIEQPEVDNRNPGAPGSAAGPFSRETRRWSTTTAPARSSPPTATRSGGELEPRRRPPRQRVARSRP